MSYQPTTDLNHQFVSPGHRAGCQDKPDSRVTVIQVQDGWTQDGRRNMREHRTEWLPIGCGHSYKRTDPACRGCTWRTA